MKKTLFLAILPLFLVSCSSNDEDNSLSKSNYTVNYGESISIGGDGNLIIDNDFVASYENGKIKGVHIGETDAIYEGSQKISITVNGTSNYLNYPVTEWNASKSSVKSKHHGGTLYSEDDENITYTINSGGKTKYIFMYSFKNGKLTGCGLVVPTNEVTPFVDWLTQKYYLSMTGDDTIFTAGMDAYNTNKATTLVGIGVRSMSTSQYVSSYAYLIAFIPASSTRGAIDEYSTNAMIDRYYEIVKNLELAEKF